MLNFLGVEFDQSEDEEVSVTDTTHLRAKDLGQAENPVHMLN